MTYPGTKIREHTALESGLIQRVTELENERDELVTALRKIADYPMRGPVAAAQLISIARALILKYPR